MPDVAVKHGWTRVAFGDVAKLSGERSSDPHGDGFDRYVGLDHIDPGDLRIRRWGAISDGTTFTNVFRPGQVLFGKRRAYQHKVARADFTGVCSGDIYVFEPKNSRLLPDLLPFICQTDGFFEHAVGTSAGSLSPRTNWDSLASYEFALPPLGEQSHIVALFKAFEDAINSFLELAHRASILYRARSSAAFSRRLASRISTSPTRPSADSPWVWKRVDECFALQLGKMSSKEAREGRDQTQYIKNNNVLWDGFALQDLPRMSFSVPERSKFSLLPGDLLVCEGGEIGRAAIWQDVGREMVFQKALHRLRPRSADCSPRFFLHYLRYLANARELEKIATGTTIMHLPQERLAALRLPFPEIRLQVSFADELDEIIRAESEALQRTERLKALKTGLMQKVLRT